MAQQLPEPLILDTDPANLTADLVALYERLTERRLLPAQPERLFIDVLVYALTLQRVGIREAVKQQLVRYARSPMLDLLGELVGVTRLGAAGGRTTLRFTLPAPLGQDLVIPAGRRVRTRDARAVFLTETALILARGSLAAEVRAVASEPGTATNGYQPGDVADLLDPMPEAPDLTVLNITPTAGGSDPEEDDHLRQRIMAAPESFSVAGPEGAYRFHALTAHPDLADVAVDSPAPGVVAVYPLLSTGLPSQEVLALVRERLNDDTVRPLNDAVVVALPRRVPFRLVARLLVYRHADPQATLAAARAAAEAYRLDRRAGLGRDLVGSQVVRALQVEGVYRVDLVSWGDRAVAPSEWADCEALDIQLAGVADG